MTHNKMGIEIVEEYDNGDGTHTLVFDVSDEFKEWFKRAQGLKRWSTVRFQNTVNEVMSQMSLKNIKKPIDNSIESCVQEYEEEIELYQTYGGD